jgi:predicted phage baseplate assembly protein
VEGGTSLNEYEKDDSEICMIDDANNDEDTHDHSYCGNKNHAKNNIDIHLENDDENDPDSLVLNDCGCCQGIEKITPLEITNPPGLSTIKYRVGTHSQFKSSMIVNLQKLDHVRKTTLVNLTTREDNDLTIALLDGWATIADVLTFYQERIANEGFLRTAKERKSIVELARSIGYELRPGVAASVFLAFMIDVTTTADEKTRIPIGTKAQSMPTEGKMPQIFETVEEIEAHYEWNELRPRLYQPQKITAESSRLYFKGTSTQLEKGDMLLVIPETGTKFSTIISEVQEDSKLDRTIVDVVPPLQLQNTSITKSTAPYDYATNRIQPDKFYLWVNSLKIAKGDPNNITIGQVKQLTFYKWTKSDLNAFSIRFALPLKELFKFINKIARDIAEIHDSTRVYTFRIKAGVFGHDAPRYDTLPKRTGKGTRKVGGEARASYRADRKKDRGFKTGDSFDVEFAPVMRDENHPNWFDLDNLYNDIVPSLEGKESWVVLSSYDVSPGSSTSFEDNPYAYRIKDTKEGSISRYLVTAKVTSLELLDADVQPQDRYPSDFRVRSTTVFAKSEQLELAESPIDDPIAGRSITLEQIVENELRIGQCVSISGEILDKANQSKKIISSEIATISNIELDGIYTLLIFDRNLHNRYKRDTVVINANIAKATHGETKEEILGGGDPMQRQQFFYLKQKPLTYVSASTPNGIKSSLEVRVDSILWKEVPFLYGHSSNDKVYVVRIDDKYEQKIIFGDDINGAKPPAGMENITSKYRVGIGIDGLVEAETINLLASRPLGVQSVVNPIASSGADNPESLEDARTNATLNVLTLDRIVSIRDTENFALAFAGIGKARAISAANNNGNRSSIQLTIASAFGDVIDKESELYENLSNAIRTYSDPSIVVSLQEFDKLLFNIEAKVAVSEERKSEAVFAEVIQALLMKFSFESRQFLQPVTLSEVVSTIHTIKGILAVDVDYLYIYGKEKGHNEMLPDFLAENIPAAAAKGNQDMYQVNTERDWLLTINPDGVKLSKMQL